MAGSRESSQEGPGEQSFVAIVEKCRALRIAGATVYRGVEGHGEGAEIHRSGVLSHDLPIVVTVVDSAENIARLPPRWSR
jgi:PII-like signaling protein